MPLLSTLAALVIIVHSTEEDYEEYRRELRPRTIDTGTTDYELPWRAVKIEPMMTQSTQSDTWDGSPQNPPKRRSPLRKRRRRPQSHPAESSLEQREYRPYNEGYRPLTEMPQRRRKKIMPNQKGNNEPIEKGRPLRRKGLRRKVPDLEPWHELSEFSDIPSDENLDMVEGNQKQEIVNYEPEFENNDSHEPRLSLSQLYKEEQNRNPEATGDATEEDNEDDPSQFAVNKENEYEEQIIPQIKEDKSLSEFSLESGNPAQITKNKNGQGTHFKENLNDVKEQKPLDPISLKEILKKSNGKSLKRVTMLEDFMTTETSTIAVTQRSTKRSRTREKPKSSTTMVPTLQAMTTETAKIEIEEILNDTLASVRLSKILMERNMTFNELVEHRERGSSHVHLADIFHNASKEPNPPEPFLSKSLIEPISKETYPLRALLEANSHNSTIKPTTVEPYLLSPHYINIPITMDFGNNVNENGENTGITALFNNFTKTVEKINNNEADNTNKNMEEPDINLANATSRQGRVIGNEQDLVTLNEIFSLMQKSQNLTDESLAITNEIGSEEKSVTDTALEDIDGDGLIALEDLQHIKHFKQNTDFISGNVEHDILESLKVTPTISIPEIIHNNTRSITVVTASIVGLIAVLFLLTYAAFKWKNQQQVYQRKQCIAEEIIPTPVFENRKSNKNSSMRSMSPMLSSNIYSVNTLEKPKNNNCPEYMWDCTRNPFQ
ncbi:unnamed protein product, partial [Iphiclides podalirius]